MNHATSILTPTILLAACTGAFAGGGLPTDPDYRIVRPSNTGIPGYTHMSIVAFGPDDRLWVGARDFFWQQGGVAALDFTTDLWKTYSSAETPLEQFNNAIDFAVDGSAWIACDDSVVHLLADGETMISHNPASVVGPFGDISIAPNQHVWVANYGQVDLGGGLFEFDGVTWIKHEEPWMTTWTGFGFAPALNVFARSNGDVWVTFISSPPRVGRYRDGQWTVYESSQGPRIIDYAEDSDTTLYGVSASGTFRLNDATGQWEQIGPFGASEIALDLSSDSLYIQSNLTTVMRFDGVSWTTFASFPGWVDGIGVGPDSHVWIAAEAWPTHWDLHEFTSAGQMLRIYNRSNTGFPDYFPPWMYRDRDGVMWFTDIEYGATRMQPDGNWRNFGIYNGQEEVYSGWVFPVGLPWWQTPGADFWSEAPNQVYHDTQGNFWFRGANYIARSAGDDLSQWTFWQPGQNGLPWLIDSMGEDAQGNIWVGNEYSLLRLNDNSWIEMPIGIPGQFAPIGLTQGKDGELYAVRVATAYRVASGAATELFSLPDGFGVITDLEVDAAGNLWMGTPDHGLVFWDGTAMTMYTPANSGLAELAVLDIAIRPSDGLIAVATSQQFTPPYDGGVAVFDGKAWTSYNYGESFLPHYGVGDMEFDADGHLWVGVLNYGAVHVLIGSDVQPIPGDVTGDGLVNVADLLAVINAWGNCPAPPAACAADITGDGLANVSDLLMVINNWS